MKNIQFRLNNMTPEDLNDFEDNNAYKALTNLKKKKAVKQCSETTSKNK